ncbi:NADH-quinone oxidoreductase [Gluconobacter thailandicus]|uniref:NADH-quinone oxidoreductase subunit N n=1 Tax=Gluconobacter thailandicus TaxID=257438 RepID=UPI0007774173|nr:NADH-quinone oxidoreductase subunit N [Gluconobacter thailandicus]KXV35475.1 NADH-quinone oxidoreductase [Gluconobacter thailandicus]
MIINGIFLPFPLFVLSVGTMLLLASVTLNRSSRLSFSLGLLTLVLATMMTYYHAPIMPLAATQTLFVADTWADYTAALILLSTSCIFILSWQDVTQRSARSADEYALLLLLGALGATAMVFSVNYMPFFLGVEILSIALIGLVTFRSRHTQKGLEAAMKYLILSGVSSAILLFGIGLSYSVTGSLVFEFSTAGHETGTGIAAAASIMVLSGIFFKLSAVPFHMWILDVMEGASVPIAGFIAVVPKIGIFSALVRYFGSEPVTPFLHNTMSAIIILTILGGNLLALCQTNLIRLMACSSIAHVGYLLIAFYSPGHFQSDTMVLYLAAYTAATLGTFSIIQAFVSPEGLQRSTISDWKGLFFTHPSLAVAMTAMLLSLAGIPPTIGFFAKFEIAASGLEQRHYVLLTALIVGSIIALYYYLNIIRLMTTPNTSLNIGQNEKKNLTIYSAVFILTLIVFIGGIFPSFFMNSIHPALPPTRPGYIQSHIPLPSGS